MEIVQIRYVRLSGGYVVECRFDEYYEDPSDEWPTGYAWFYDIKDDDDEVLASDGPYQMLYWSLSDAFKNLADLEYERTGLEYTVELCVDEARYMVVIRNLRDDYKHDGDPVVFSEYICDNIYYADLESHDALAYLAELQSSAFNKYYKYWLEQEKSRRETGATYRRHDGV